MNHALHLLHGKPGEALNRSAYNEHDVFFFFGVPSALNIAVEVMMP